MKTESQRRSLTASFPGTKVHVWGPDLFGEAGGIQRFSRYFLKALQNYIDPDLLTVIIKNDDSGSTIPPEFSNLKYHHYGNWQQELRTLMFAGRLSWLGYRENPELIISLHANFAQVAYQLNRWRGIPYWIVAHGIEVWRNSNGHLGKYLSAADRILAVSNFTRKQLLQNFVLKPENVVVLPNTFDEDQFRVASKPLRLLEKYHLKPTQPIILTVARLAEPERYKGYDRIIEALPEVRSVLPEVHYLIVGKGEDRARIISLARDKGVLDCITLAGFVPDEELAEYYNLCDVFAMPSMLEGFGIVYLEALASGKPTLAGNRDGSVDALCNGELGALIDPENVPEITATLLLLLTGKFKNQTVFQPEVLRAKVISKYGFDAFQQKLGAFLQSRLEAN